MNHFDPSEFVRGLQQLLISDKKRIGFLFGAGTSVAKKDENSPNVPAVFQMTNEIVEALSSTNDKYKKCFNELKEKEIQIGKFNIETILSRLELKRQVIGAGSLNGLKLAELETLIQEIKDEIKSKASIHKTIKSEAEKCNLIQTDFAEWIGGVSRKYPIEIFTTNYDLLFEVGLEHNKVPFFTGFTGSHEPFFSPELVENFDFFANQTKLWKIHGSLGWFLNEENGFVVKKYPTENDILIYPSHLKYNQSQKQPYTSLMDRLSAFLRKDDGVLFTCGYSFGDEHINERILSSLKTNTNSHVIGLFYDKSWDESSKSYTYSLQENSSPHQFAKLSSKIAIYGRKNAIIGRNFGQWKLRKEPSSDDTPSLNLYFDEDAPISNAGVGEVVKNSEQLWKGTGEFLLTDFVAFVKFLGKMLPNIGEKP